jgi:light-regulated signal transduction histidine kinase (bacteriophytochrome)
MDGEDGPVVFVRDNGVGFNMKYADRYSGFFSACIGRKISKAPESDSPPSGRIIQKHGGRIWAQAEIDKSAAFYFSLGSHSKNERLCTSSKCE